MDIKKILAAAAVLFLIFSLSQRRGYAVSTEKIANEVSEKLSAALPEKTRESLEEKNIVPQSGAGQQSFGDFIGGLWELAVSRAQRPFFMFLAFCGAVMLCAVGESLAPDGTLKGLMPAVGGLCTAGICAGAISEILNEALGALSTAANFTLVFISAFAGITAILGFSGSAAAANAAVVAAAQLFSQITANLLAPICGLIMGFSAAGAAHPELKIERMGDVVKKFTVWGLTLMMTIFTGVLSVQTAVAAAADSAALKAAKFVVSKGVPIVGGTISDAVSTMTGGFAMLKASVGAYGVVAAAALILPVLALILCYGAAFAGAGALAEAFGVKPAASLAKSCGQVISIIAAVCACFLLLNFISMMILLTMTNE